MPLKRSLNLSDRQLEIAGLLPYAYSYADIGAALGISERTVRMHVAEMKRKLGVETKAQLIQKLYLGSEF